MGLKVLLFAAYCVLSYLAVRLGSAGLSLAALACLAAAPLSRPLLEWRPWAWLLVLALGAAALAASEQRVVAARVAVLLAPAAINLALAVLFGHTLLAGRMPLVERIVRLLHAPEEILDAAVYGYARAVTGLWTALFVFNATTCLVLALLATPRGLLATLGWPPPVSVPLAAWAFFADFGCYGLTALLFLGEFLYRRRRFPWQPYRSLGEFLRSAAGVGPALAAELWPRKPPRGDLR
ncbi:MAG: hypothetical protein JSR73_16135 [Proteobacteria bacterium]|nr:hypothetical protein [Pseudomonadota bacterium]